MDAPLSPNSPGTAAAKSRRRLLVRLAELAVVAAVGAGVAVWLQRDVPPSTGSTPSSAAAPALPTQTQGRRVALLLGNDDYPQSPLANPLNDLRLMEKTLKNPALGFKSDDIIVAKNQSREETLKLFKQFAQKARGASLALFYYSGHGIRGADGQNYLQPVGATIKDEADIEIYGVPFRQLRDDLGEDAGRFLFLLYDACRNNLTLKTRNGATRGLARESVSGGLVIAYATKEGATADDGDDGNSPFASALAANLARPGVEVVDLMRNVAQDMKATAEANRRTPQKPEIMLGDLDTKYYLVPAAPTPVVAQAPAPSDVAPTPASPATPAAPASQTAVSPAPSSGPGSTFKDCVECPEMMVIPGGDGIVRFSLSRTEVTQAQFRSVMGYNPSRSKTCGNECPVEEVTSDVAAEFARKLSKKTGKRYRLPSDKEWVHACLAGSTTEYCGGNNLGELAWFSENSGNSTHPVAGKKENAFGIYDMSGNVWEYVLIEPYCSESQWCDDKALRGGAATVGAKLLRSSSRHRVNSSGDLLENFGIRVARDID